MLIEPPRSFTVREAPPDGHISTIGNSFGTYSTLARAQGKARRLAKLDPGKELTGIHQAAAHRALSCVYGGHG
jgi:hypothetical protein